MGASAKKQNSTVQDLPKSFETRDVIAGLQQHTIRSDEILQLIKDARLDRLLEENLEEQRKEAVCAPGLHGAAYVKHVERFDKLSAQYNKLMAERFGPDEK
jgi:hypothetical protein